MPVPPLIPIIVLAGAGAALLYAAKKVREALDTVDKNLDSIVVVGILIVLALTSSAIAVCPKTLKIHSAA